MGDGILLVFSVKLKCENITIGKHWGALVGEVSQKGSLNVLHVLIVFRCIDIQQSNEVERTQALRLVRKVQPLTALLHSV